MPHKNTDEVSAEILADLMAKYPKHHFVLIVVEPVKHPDNGTPGHSSAIAANVGKTPQLIFWLQKFLMRALQGLGRTEQIKH